MKKVTSQWKIGDLRELFSIINFPEYQREPNLWDRVSKQRLIDSILRQFDIASLYLYEQDDRSMDCIDGRQRIGAIMSFLGENPEDVQDNAFEYKVLNEIFPDEEAEFAEFQGMRFADICQSAEKSEKAKAMRDRFLQYEITVVQLAKSERPEEFNLQFTRLNLGTIINSGEKLHAMVGAIRDACFSQNGLGQHPFLAGASIPTRRFAREQTAAQILAQIFSLHEGLGYARMRHFDLQRLFKAKSKLTVDELALVERVRALLDLLEKAFAEVDALRSRSITVSTVLLAWQLQLSNLDEAKKLALFVYEFVIRLRWQVSKKLDIDSEYRYLMDFQRHLTQASVEKPAVAARAEFLMAQFESWKQIGRIRGDAEYQTRTGRDPANECRPEPGAPA